jgi:hypothetical protein
MLFSNKKTDGKNRRGEIIAVPPELMRKNASLIKPLRGTRHGLLDFSHTAPK